MRKIDRVDPYGTVRGPSATVTVKLNERATARLKELQAQLQERRDRKVAAKEIFSELLLGTLKVND